MVNLLKTKHKLCRKYNEDIWGKVISQGKFNKLGEFLALNSKKTRRTGSTSGFKTIINDRKKVCLFYGGLKVWELMNYCKLAKYNGSGAFSNDVVSLLERRLCVVVYRMQFANSIAQAKEYIRAGYFLVNKELVKSPNTLVEVGNVIQVNPKYREKIFTELSIRIKKEFIVLKYPKYLEVNYKILSGLIIYEPVISEVYYPFNLDENFFYIAYHSRIR